jgi:hypothetical protein
VSGVERFKVPALYVPAPFAEVADKDGLTTTVLAADYDQLTAELQQSRDIREDMGLLLTMLSQRLGVSQEPHQTWNDRILEAASRVAELEGALAWRPIETAPKDRLIDIWIPGDDGSGTRWCDCYYDRICDDWRTSRPGGKLVWVRANHVTYWMNPPAPPAVALKGQG